MDHAVALVEAYLRVNGYFTVSEYPVVAAEMDMYPKYVPWVFVDPPIAGARDDGKLVLDLHWDPASPSFELVIGAVIAHIESCAA